jgi:hypothetical protein
MSHLNVFLQIFTRNKKYISPMGIHVMWYDNIVSETLEDKDNGLFRNIGAYLPDYKASHPRIQKTYSPTSEPQIAQRPLCI